ncbi:MAG: DinB family protein [Acidobacteriota bacterium]
MKRILALSTLALSIVFPSLAQQPAESNPVSESMRFLYNVNKQNIVAAAEKMPEADFNFRPTPFSRSFAETLGHIVDAQYLFCSQLRGESNPLKQSIEKTMKTKSELLKAVKDSFDYCDGTFNALTDAMLSQKTRQGRPNAFWPLINIYHGGEHYGNLSTYLRLKYLVPPSTERALERQRKELEEKARQENQAKPAFEMDTYQVGLFKRGPRWSVEQAEESRRLQSAHLAHLGKMAEAGKLVGAGPFLDGGELRGILIFKAASIEEARAMAEADPAVKSGRLIIEFHPWLGPRGIGERYAAEMKNNPSVKTQMVTYQFGLLIKGQRWTAESSPELDRLQADHLAHIRRMGETGKLVAAGPFLDGGFLRGILIFRSDTTEEARAMAAEDPMMKTGHLALDIRPLMMARGVLKD